MASVKYFMKKNPRIYIRFSNGKMFDITSSTNINIDPKHWDKKNQKIKNVIAIPNRELINEKLALLKLGIINQFNNAYISGDIIDKSWLDKTINDFFNRPEKDGNDGKHLIYLSDFAQWWLDEKASHYKVLSANKYMDNEDQKRYLQVLINILEFQGKDKVKLKETDTMFFDKISHYFTNDKKYAYNTTKRKIGRVKFFCARAENENLKVHKGYKERVLIQDKAKKYKYPYLNPDEINAIVNYKSDNNTLNVVRDNWIIGLWTGLRISDLGWLNMSNIHGDFIDITNKKTKTDVSIPLHYQVKEVLKKYNGKLPPKISDSKFNKYIKVIAKDLGMDQIMAGGISKKNGFKVYGKYPKYELITSHICRRSFCTNLFGKVPNQVIMSVQGWKSESQMEDYNQQTNRESAIKLKAHWDKIETK